VTISSDCALSAFTFQTKPNSASGTLATIGYIYQWNTGTSKPIGSALASGTGVASSTTGVFSDLLITLSTPVTLSSGVYYFFVTPAGFKHFCFQS
jgi:hypothetical protein